MKFQAAAGGVQRATLPTDAPAKAGAAITENGGTVNFGYGGDGAGWHLQADWLGNAPRHVSAVGLARARAYCSDNSLPRACVLLRKVCAPACVPAPCVPSSKCCWPVKCLLIQGGFSWLQRWLHPAWKQRLSARTSLRTSLCVPSAKGGFAVTAVLRRRLLRAFKRAVSVVTKAGNRRLGNRLQRRDSVDTSLDTCALRMGGGDVSGLAFRLLIQGGNISTLICFSVAAMPSI